MSGVQLVLIPMETVAKIVLTSSLVTWEALGQYYWAIILSLLPIIIGFSFSRVFMRVLDREWHGVLTLGCTFQNGLVFPLSVVVNLKGIDWLDGQSFQLAQETLFLYNLLCSMGLWAVGEPLVRSCKEALDREEEEKRALLPAHGLQRDDTETDSHGKGRHLHKDDDGRHATGIVAHDDDKEEEEHEIVRNGEGSRDGIEQVRRNDDLRHGDDEGESGDGERRRQPGRGERVWCHLKVAANALKSPPVAVSLLAIFISLVPPLRWLMDSYVGHIVIGGLRQIGTGCVPLQLLLLGCSLTSTKGSSTSSTEGGETAEPTSSSGDAEPSGAIAEPQNSEESHHEHEDRVDIVVEAHARDQGGRHLHGTCSSFCQKLIHLYHRVPQVTVFIILTVALRLVIVPAVTVLIVHLLFIFNCLPKNRAFMLSLLIAVCSPSAINSSLICSMYKYKVTEYARMIFIMYVTAIATATVWLVFALWYVKHFISE